MNDWASKRKSMSTRGILSLLFLMCIAAVADAATTSALTSREKAQGYAAKGVAQFEAGNIDEAKRLLEEALQTDSKVYEAHFWLGRLYAQSAGSSTQARKKAIEHLRAALQLQPYGEEGDLFRSWLVKVAGRPKSVILVPVRSAGEKNYDYHWTDELIKGLSSRATKAGFSAQTMDEQELRQRDAPLVSRRDNGKSDPPSKEDLKRLALDADGLPSAGWVIFVGAGDVRSSYDNKRGSSASAEADVWVGDALAYLLHPKMWVSSSSLTVFDLLLKGRKDYSQAQNDALSGLGSIAWDKIGRIIATERENQPLDEMLVPTRAPGIYARSTANAFQDACGCRSLAIHYTCPEDEVSASAAQGICAQLQRRVLTTYNLNCISPSYANRLVEGESAPEAVGKMLVERVGASWVLIAHSGENVHAFRRKAFTRSG